MTITTLCFLFDGDQILLPMKKQGFGVGKHNGFGGKKKSGETIVQSLIREAKEEVGVEILEDHLEKIGVIKFSFEGKSDWNQTCHVYKSYRWKRKPRESEEMKPKWFNITQLPYERMWVDDPHWVPYVLRGKKIKAKFHFLKDGAEIGDMKIQEVPTL